MPASVIQSQSMSLSYRTESQLFSFLTAISVGREIDRSQVYRYGGLSALSGSSLRVLEVLKQVQHVLLVSVHGSWPSWPIELRESCSGSWVLGLVDTSQAGRVSRSHAQRSGFNWKEGLPVAAIDGGCKALMKGRNAEL